MPHIAGAGRRGLELIVSNRSVFGVESKSGTRFPVVFIRSVFFIELTHPAQK
jgi:hypothetical protein